MSSDTITVNAVGLFSNVEQDASFAATLSYVAAVLKESDCSGLKRQIDSMLRG